VGAGSGRLIAYLAPQEKRRKISCHVLCTCSALTCGSAPGMGPYPIAASVLGRSGLSTRALFPGGQGRAVAGATLDGIG